MGKIAAIVLPRSREEDLEALSQRMASQLSVCDFQKVEKSSYRGKENVSCLMRVLPDAINPASQPFRYKSSRAVLCGYYISGEAGAGLLEDLVDRGAPSLTKGDGVFAFASWDENDEILFAGVDKLGMRPLYGLELPRGGWAVASEIKALLPLLSEPEPDWESWEYMLRFGYLFGDRTPVEGIRRLAPAELREYRDGKVHSRILENFLAEIPLRDRGDEEFIEENHARFGEAMERLHDVIPAGAESIFTLSGGFDSRRILGWLLEKGASPEVYTVPDVLRDGTEYESGIAEALCAKFGLEGRFVYPADRRAEEKFLRGTRDLAADFESDEHLYATTMALAVDRRRAVNYDGLGGDILVNGLYLKESYFTRGDDAFLGGLSPGVREWFKLPGIDDRIEDRLKDFLARFGGNPNRFTFFYFFSRTRREVGLAPAMVQANVFESFFPFLDRRFLECSLAHPARRKAGTDFQKTLIQRIRPDLLEIPFTHDKNLARHARLKKTGMKEQVKYMTWVFRDALAYSREHPHFGLGRKQKRLAGIVGRLPWLFSRRRLNWEFYKADAAMRCCRFCSMLSSSGGYARAVDETRNLFGTRSDWISPMKK